MGNCLGGSSYVNKVSSTAKPGESSSSAGSCLAFSFHMSIPLIEQSSVLRSTNACIPSKEVEL
jgi:hypothetical protein